MHRSFRKARGPRPFTRREVLRGTAALSGAVAAPWLIPASARGADGTVAPSGRITVGLIGVGVMGSGHLSRLVGDKGVQLLAVCDVDRSRREAAAKRVEEAYAEERANGAYRGCAAYNDYRELLARGDIEAVVIVTPDHWHTLMAVDAAKAGKDVYCEKPVSVTIREGRHLSDTMRRCGRVFQTGTQYRSISTIRRVCAAVRGGALGRVTSAYVLWHKVDLGALGRSYAPFSPALPGEPVPEGLDWDLWVGPAPWHPYHPRYHRNPAPGVVPWAFCEEFGVASVTWFHAHAADVIQYALGVEESGPVEILHPSGGAFPTLTCRYADGTLLHHVDHWGQVKQLYRAVPDTARLEGNFGGVFVGERGWLTSMTGGGPIEGGPEALFQDLPLVTREVSAGDNNHHANWFECIRTRQRTRCDAEIGHRSASLGHVVIIAHKLQRSLTWDPATEAFVGDDEANRLRSRAMRQPWRL